MLSVSRNYHDSAPIGINRSVCTVCSSDSSAAQFEFLRCKCGTAVQISHNRSLDGVLDLLNSKNMTEAGPVDLIDDPADDQDDLLPPPGESKPTTKLSCCDALLLCCAVAFTRLSSSSICVSGHAAG